MVSKRQSKTSPPTIVFPDGFLMVDKPEGITSFRVVDRLKKHFRIGKLGHGGSLDPLATGLLVLLVNRGTKQADLLLAGEKEYDATVLLGTETDSQDITGKVVRKLDSAGLNRDAIERALGCFRGQISQTPPMVSALKYRGERLYTIARRGEEVPRLSRKVMISRLTLVGNSGPRVRLAIRCSKGTYIRTLCHDLGRTLGCGACLAALRRIAVGPFRIEDAVPLDQLLAGSPEELSARIIPVDRLLRLLGSMPSATDRHEAGGREKSS